MERYRLIGVELSPYTIKLRAVMRYRRIPHLWICRFPQYFSETKDLKPGLMPVVQYPDGTYHTDSTFICEDLEKLHPENRTIYPPDKVLGFVALLIEDLCDEWLSKIIFHYRFSYDRDRSYAPRWVMDDTYPSLTGTELDRCFESFLERQTNRMEIVGCTPENSLLFESGFVRLVESMERFVANGKFLFGSRPSIADFSLYGQLAILMQDLTPGEIMRHKCPRTIAWLMRIADSSGVDGEWEERDEPLEIVNTLLSMAGSIYLPYLNANATAVRNDAPYFSARLGGHNFEQPTFRYHAKCREFLTFKYNELSHQERRLLRTYLGDTGCLDVLGRLQSS